ncbi:hypothetical protein [Aequorivita sp. KMM 9714]|uniref:hypothetical protein n=1 Tax=Aequorivita sp. KMM 9714 TaxID=2707173 RepID=UPI0013EBB5F7|nr:hypothetical protein [Aequorivita sp. KMM 9714]NGX85012.1 hypothetical protein [Aequorivita sp. KMM 9714]
MKNTKITFGLISLIIGIILFILLVDLISKPSNLPVAFDPIGSFQTYFFSFSFTLGVIGWVIGSLLFIGYLILFYFIGTWISKMISKQ